MQVGHTFCALYLLKNTLYMKRTLLLAVLSASLLFSNHSQAQIPGVHKITKALPKVDLGIKAGANFQDLSKNSTFKSSYAGGFVGGLFFGVTKNKIGVDIEALVKTVKYTSVTTITNQTYTINGIYLDVPVLFEYRLVPRLWLQIGPQFSDMLSAKQGSTDVKKSFNSTDFAGVLGLEAKLPAHLILGARYLLGVTDIHNESTSTTKDAWNNRSIQLYLGFRFI
jgi:outer membrane protein with beta-barrel domain